MAGCGLNTTDFARELTNAGVSIDRDTAIRWFKKWRAAGVASVEERPSHRGGRTGSTLVIDEAGVAAFLRGELPVP